MGVMATVISNHKVATILDIIRHVHKLINLGSTIVIIFCFSCCSSSKSISNVRIR